MQLSAVALAQDGLGGVRHANDAVAGDNARKIGRPSQGGWGTRTNANNNERVPGTYVFSLIEYLHSRTNLTGRM
jgi:hypothetical protein